MPEPLSDRIRAELEDLTLDAIAATRAMLESGDSETRINVINRVLPTVQKILAADSGSSDAESDFRNEARELLAETWGPLTPKDKAS